MNSKVLTFLCLITVVLAACSKGNSSHATSAEGVTKAFETNIIPTLNTDSGLSIKDTDSNGVRDDVDSLIKAKYTVASDISAAIQYAQAMQLEVLASPPDPSAIPGIALALTQAVDCAAAQMGPARAADMIAEIRAATANTKERFTAYRETQAALSGQHAVISEDDPKTFCK